MVLISQESLSVVFLSLFKIFICDILVTTESISISEILIKLNRPAEELDSSLMLSLKTVAVAHYTPSFRSE